MIIDTNALSGFAEGHLGIRESVARAPGPFLPAIVFGEYRFGLLGSRERKQRLAWLDELAREWFLLAVTRETAWQYSEIRERLKAQATPIPSNDTWIAALALQHGFPILSDDPHFDLIPGIERIGF